MSVTERIEAWLQVRDAQRFQRDMKRSAKSVRELREESKHLNKQGVTLAQGFGGMRVSLGQFTALAFGSLPIITGLGGAIGALTSSAAAGTAGIGALAVGIGGILMPSLIGVGILTTRAAGNFGDIKTALDAYRLSVAAYGRDSTQAETALRRLAGTVDQHGGVRMLRAVMLWKRLGDQFDRMTRSGRDDLAGIMTNGLRAADRLLPAFARNTNRSMAAIRRDSAAAFDVFSNGEAQSGLDDFGAAFDRISGPATRGFVDVIVFFFRVARASIPSVISLADGFERFGQSLDRASDDPEKLGHTIEGLVSHTRSWMYLFKETGLLIFQVFRAGAGEGQSLVDTLGQGVHNLRMLASTASGQSDIAGFFHDSVEETKAFAVALWVLLEPLLELARDAMPLWTDILTANAVGIQMVLSLVLWLSNLMEPLGGLLGIVIVGFWGWKAAVFAWNIVAGIAAFLTSGWTTAFWALNSAMYANPIGLIILAVLAVAGGLYYAYTHSERFRNAIQSVFGWIRDNWPLLLGILTGPIGFAVYMIIKHFDTVKSAGKSTINFIIGLFNAGIDLINAFTPGKIEIPFAPDFPGIPDIPNIPLLGTGGIIGGPGSWITGDRGPELNTYDGSRIHVSPVRSAPVSGRGTVRPIDPARLAGAGRGPITVIVQVEGREIGRAVADDTDDRLARGPGEDD